MDCTFFKPKPITREPQNRKDNKRPNVLTSEDSNKKVTIGNMFLEYKGKGLSKFSDLKYGLICKSCAVQGFTCNRGCMCGLGSHMNCN